MRRTLALVLAASLATSCAPTTRKYVGGGIAFGGLLVAAAGVAALRPCVPVDAAHAEPNHPDTCTTGHSNGVIAYPNVGVPLVARAEPAQSFPYAALAPRSMRSTSSCSNVSPIPFFSPDAMAASRASFEG
jgi:hypothetical protein